MKRVITRSNEFVIGDSSKNEALKILHFLRGKKYFRFFCIIIDVSTVYILKSDDVSTANI